MTLAWPQDILSKLKPEDIIDLHPLNLICSLSSNIEFVNIRAEQYGFAIGTSIQKHLHDIVSKRTWIQVIAEQASSPQLESSDASLMSTSTVSRSSESKSQFYRSFHLATLDSMHYFHCQVVPVSYAESANEERFNKLFVSGVLSSAPRGQQHEFYTPSLEGKFVYDMNLIGEDENAVIATDIQAKCIFMNDSVEKMYGWTRTDLVGNRLKDFIVPVDAETHNQADEIFERLALGDTYQGTFKLLKKNGEIVDINVSDYPIFDKKNKLIGVVGVSSIINDKDDLSSNLDVELNSSFDLSYESIFVIAKNGTFEILWTSDDFVKFVCTNEKFSSFPLILNGKSLKDFFKRVNFSQDNQILSWGKKRFLVKRFPLDIFEGSSLFYFKKDDYMKNQLEVDISAAAKEAEQLDYKIDFITVMSHEMRTPLHGILGELEYVREKLLRELKSKDEKFLVEFPTKIYESLEVIESCSSIQLQLVNNILDWQKLASGKVQFEAKTFDLHNVINSMSSNFRALLKLKSIELKTSISAPQYIIGDRMKMIQILLNFTSNAVKYSHERSSIIITAKTVKSEFIKNNYNYDYDLILSVEDNGPGIEAKFRHLLFHRFSQVPSEAEGQNSNARNSPGGTGLGLYIVKQLATAIDGTVGYNPRIPNGSLFFLRIPLFEAQKDMDVSVVEESLPLLPKNIPFSSLQMFDDSATVNNFNDDDKFNDQLHFAPVLIVEDNKINARLLMKMLERMAVTGDLIKHAENGKLAIDEFASNPIYKTILMDISMPVMDGLEATRLLRDFGCKSKIIGITANASDHDRTQGFKSGMDEFLVKPVMFEILKSTILSK